jgi:hypothetical protein
MSKTRRSDGHRLKNFSKSSRGTTKGSLLRVRSARVSWEVTSEWVEATKDGDGLMAIRSHCGLGPTPDPIYLRLT